MRFSCDRLGYPLLGFPDLGLEAFLLPVLKVQFERFLAEPDAVRRKEEPFLDDAWYAEILGVSRRAPWRPFPRARREELFMTAVRPPEALAFARWLGPDFDLPTGEEWKTMYGSSLGTSGSAFPVEGGPPRALCPAASAVLRGLQDDDEARRARKAAPRSLADVALLRGGVLEWVRFEGGFRILGAPRWEFFHSVINPLHDGPLKILSEARNEHIGFRLVRRSRWGNESGGEA